MKALTIESYGSPDVLQVKDVEKPEPKKNEVLIKIFASSVNAGDWHLMRADPALVRLYSGLLKPRFKILGCDVAGVVEAVGKDIKHFKVGDEVYGDLSSSSFGGFAEYTCAKEDSLAIKPKNLNFEEAASVPSAALTALQGIRDYGQAGPGKSILINGASGGVGSFALQIAKALGAHVTAVGSSRKLESMKSMGADEVIDYCKEDFTQNGKTYDVIHGVNGYHPIGDYAKSLSKSGIYVMSGGSNRQLMEVSLKGPFMSKKNGQRFKNYLVNPNKSDLVFLTDLIEQGKIKPQIDCSFPLEQGADAVRYLEAGKAKGKVVISITE